MAANRVGKKAGSARTKIAWATRFTATAMVLGLIFGAARAQAISRYNPTGMSCSAIQAVVRAEGAVILRWTQPPDILRYDRFVAGNQYCGVEQRVTTATVPSADQSQCEVYVCRHFEPPDLFFLFKQSSDRASKSRAR